MSEWPLGGNELSVGFEAVNEDRVDVVTVGVALKQKLTSIFFAFLMLAALWDASFTVSCQDYNI